MPAAVRPVQPGSDLGPGDPAAGGLAGAAVAARLHEAQAQHQGATRRQSQQTQREYSVWFILCLLPPTGLPLPGRRRLLFLCLVRLVSTAPRVEEPAENPRRRPSGQRPAGSGRAARAGDHDASVPGAQHGVLTARCPLHWSRWRCGSRFQKVRIV